MAPEGDITDAFDDDDLKNSITAGEAGPWNDETATFEDPRLTKVKKELTGQQTTGYQERRMRELQEQAAQKEDAAQRTATATKANLSNEALWGDAPATFDDGGNPDIDEWREPEPAPAPTTPEPVSANPRITGTAARPATQPSATAAGTRPAWWLWAILILAAAAMGYLFAT